MFGGWTNEGKVNDLFEYNIDADKWKELKPKNPPSPRSAHSCVVVGKYMYLYAGIGDKKFGDMYRYHFDKGEWENVSQVNAPLPRSSYGGLILLEREGKQLLFHSCGLGCGRYNDTNFFDIKSKIWTTVTNKGELVPSKRGRHACVHDKEKNCILLIGGFSK